MRGEALTTTETTRTRGALLAVALLALYLTARANYLLFHALAEVFSVVVAFSVFVIGVTSRRYLDNAYLPFLSVAYLFLGLLDLLHTLAFSGMSVFAEPGYQANQLWIAARYLEALSLLAAFAAMRAGWRIRILPLASVYAAITAAVIASIFPWKIFPVCFVAGQGQTAFKIASEYVVIGLLALALVLLRSDRARFEPTVLRAIGLSMAFAIASEFCFTLYVSNFGPANLAGHLFKVASYAAIFLALVETGIARPTDLIFRDLTAANTRLSAEIEARKRTEEVKDAAIRDLHAALEEVRTLRGIIPICSHCKKIRDDQGAWNRLEAYIQRHSEAQFSHGICPDCLAQHYPFVKP